MAISYTQTATASGASIGGTGSPWCSGGGTGGLTIDKLASEGGTPSGSPVNVITVASGADILKGLFEIVPAEGVSWDAGTWTVRFNVTTANMNVTWDAVYICRVDSSDANQATIGSATGLAISLGTTGVKSTTVSGSAQAPSANDKVLVLLLFDNGSMSQQAVDITPDQDIDSPFTAAAVLIDPLDDEMNQGGIAAHIASW